MATDVTGSEDVAQLLEKATALERQGNQLLASGAFERASTAFSSAADIFCQLSQSVDTEKQEDAFDTYAEDCRMQAALAMERHRSHGGDDPIDPAAAAKQVATGRSLQHALDRPRTGTSENADLYERLRMKIDECTQKDDELARLREENKTLQRSLDRLRKAIYDRLFEGDTPRPSVGELPDAIAQIPTTEILQNLQKRAADGVTGKPPEAQEAGIDADVPPESAESDAQGQNKPQQNDTKTEAEAEEPKTATPNMDDGAAEPNAPGTATTFWQHHDPAKSIMTLRQELDEDDDGAF